MMHACMAWHGARGTHAQVGDYSLDALRTLRWPGSGDGVLTVEEAIQATTRSVSRVILVRRLLRPPFSLLPP